MNLVTSELFTADVMSMVRRLFIKIFLPITEKNKNVGYLTSNIIVSSATALNRCCGKCILLNVSNENINSMKVDPCIH